MTERLGAGALAELFLFERLTGEQLAWLAERGEVAGFEAGTEVYRVGEPATCLYVLLEGTLSMVMRAPGGEIEVNRTDHRGTYAGAFFAYLDLPVARSYSTGLRTVTDCRFWVLPAEDFGWAVREWFPMATHMLEGFAIQGMGSQQTVSTRERLVALGTVTAGLTHELNNPATATARATATLAERLAGLWDELAGLASGGLDGGQLEALVGLVRQAVRGRAGQAPLSPLEASDREDELGGWLEEHGVPGAWDLAPPLVAAGVGTGWLDRVAATVPARVLPHIFEPFYTTKPVGKGTGLGLDICWRIVAQRHHGDLRFSSAPGDTRFQVLLPLTQDG
ncbi:MAG TPA: ATP-binding protein, partial [Actinomycetota bacterium]|nr:ATP-binding protein [Actinomycetota bacterium]